MVAAPTTIEEAGAGFRAGALTSEELTAMLLERAQRSNPDLGAFVTLCHDSALATARQRDHDFAAGVDRGLLQGIPVAVKDILLTADAPTTAQSRAHPPSADGVDAAVVARLRTAGAVIVGKTSTSEFAIGLPDPNSPFPLPRNPWDLNCWAGGSSAGTAGGLAAGLFLGGIGTDTGGSIRIPAAFCGVTGLKPSFGRVPRGGCLQLSKTLDHIGPMARSARECALLLDAIATGEHSFFAALGRIPDGIRIGVARVHETAGDAVDPAAADAFEAAVDVLAGIGAHMRDLAIARFAALADATSVVLLSEALQRHRHNLAARWTDYGRDTRLRIATGAFYSGADYASATAVLARGQEDMRQLFESVDVVVTLTSGIGAWRLDELSLDAPLRAPFFTRPWNGLGLPAISLPGGFDSRGHPIGLQIIGPELGDATVLRLADAYQSQTDWHRRTSPFTRHLREAQNARAAAGSSTG